MESVSLLALDHDSLLQVLLRMGSTLELKTMLCTCKLIRGMWEQCSTQIPWYPECKGNYLIDKGRTYGQYLLSTEQANTLEWLWTQGQSKSIGFIGSHVQLPMSIGKTAIQLIYCLERVRTLGGLAVASFTDKVLGTATEEVVKIVGGNIYANSWFYEGVTIIRDPQDYFIINHSITPTLLFCSRHSMECYNIIPLAHTVTMDESHTGKSSALRVLKSALDSSTARVIHIACFTATNVQRLRVDDREVVRIDRGNSVVNKHLYLDYYGCSAVSSMTLPPIRCKIVCTTPGPFVVVPSETSQKATLSQLDTIHAKMTANARTNDYTAMWKAPGLRDECAFSMTILKEAVGEMLGASDEPVFVMTGGHYYGGLRCTPMAAKVLKGTHVTSINQLVRALNEGSKVLVGNVHSFSEGVNIPFIHRLVLFHTDNNPELMRQCIGRFRRVTSRAKEITVTIIANSPCAPLLSIVPSPLIESYMVARGTKVLKCVDKDFSQVYPDLCFSEIVGVCYKTNNKLITRNWVAANGMSKMCTYGYDLLRFAEKSYVDNTTYSLRDAYTFFIDSEATGSTVPLISVPVTRTLRPPIPQVLRIPTIAQALDTYEVMKKKLNETRSTAPKKRGPYTIDDLKKICDHYKLIKTGTRSQLCDRLLQYIS